MEWDQITDGWAAMTNRLRGDALGDPRNIGGPQDAIRTTTRGDGDLPDAISDETVGAERSLQSNR